MTTMTTNNNTIISTINDAIAEAVELGTDQWAAISVTRGQGMTDPSWVDVETLRAIIDEIRDGADWEPIIDCATRDAVEDDDEASDVMVDVRSLMERENVVAVDRWWILRRIYSGEYVTPSDDVEYIVLWRYNDDGIVKVDELLEWIDDYDGDMPELDPDDYDTEEEMEIADAERRRQYWRLTGRIALGRADWELELKNMGVDPGSAYWEAAEEVAARYRDITDFGWPVDCYLSYRRGDGDEDPYDSLEGAGEYSIINL